MSKRNKKPIYSPLGLISQNTKDLINTHALNNNTFLDYFFRLEEMAINMFEWKNLPDSVDVRFLELILCEYGLAVFFNDIDLGYLTLTVAISGKLDVYRTPTEYRAYAITGFNAMLNKNNSVLIYNNYLRTNTVNTLFLYARRLYEIERAIDVNVQAQKTPILLECAEEEKLTVKNAIQQYMDNEPIIVAQKNFDIKNKINVLDIRAPFVAKELNTLKRQIWNEALTFLGIETNSSDKKERLITQETESNLGGVKAQREIMLNARRDACKRINKMFGLNVSVDFRTNLSTDIMANDIKEGEINE